MKKWNTILTFALAAVSAFLGLSAFCRRGHAKFTLRGVLWLAGSAFWIVNGIHLLTDREPLVALEITTGGEDCDE